MSVTLAQENAFLSGTVGVPMDAFQLTIMLVLYSALYLWATWVIVTQWKSWSNRNINFYEFLMRSVRSILVTLFASFLLI